MTITLTKSQLAQLINDNIVDYSNNPIIDTPDKVYELLKYYSKLKQEHFIVLTLDGANRLINKHEVTVGTLTSSLVHPREVFKRAIDDVACSIIIAHNHPSNNKQASETDRAVTERLMEVGEVVGIKLQDHIIITKDGYTSII